jgi:integrase
MAVKRTKITEKAIAKMRAPDPSGKQKLHWDSELHGFGILCSGVSNSRTYVAQRDLPDGRTRRVTVGSVSEISLEVARKRAADTLDDLRRGRDPKKKLGSLRQALEMYLAARKDLRPASIKVYRTSVEKYLESWLDLPLRDITSEMIEDKHRAIAAQVGNGERYKGEVTANLAMRVVRIIWNFAKDRAPELPENPVKRLRRQWYAEPRRKRIVSIEDLPKFYAAVRALQNPVAADYLTLLLFTGLRLGESVGLTWQDVDLPQRIIHVPAARTKNKRDFVFPMSDVVHNLLVGRRAIGNAKFVFPGPGAVGHIADPSWPLTHVANSCGVLVSAHDLRRTYITAAASTPGITAAQIKSLVNHSGGGDVTSGYIVFNVESLRAPAQAVADRLKELCSIKQIEGVTRLSEGRK